MTREEAAAKIGYIIDCVELGIYCGEDEEVFEALDLALSALPPITREQVEKVKKEPEEGGYDEWWRPSYACPECGYENAGKGNFCHNCGCPFTDDAVQMVMERLEALKDGSMTD